MGSTQNPSDPPIECTGWAVIVEWGKSSVRVKWKNPAYKGQISGMNFKEFKQYLLETRNPSGDSSDDECDAFSKPKLAIYERVLAYDGPKLHEAIITKIRRRAGRGKVASRRLLDNSFCRHNLFFFGNCYKISFSLAPSLMIRL